MPVTASPTKIFAVLDSPVTTGELNDRVLDPLVVAFALSVICVDELIAAIAGNAAGMPVPVTDSPTGKRFAKPSNSPVTTGELNDRVLDPPVVAFALGVIMRARG